MLRLEIRGPDLVRHALQVDMADVQDLQLSPKWRALGVWSLKMPAAHEAVGLLAQPGWGIVVSGDYSFTGLTGSVTIDQDVSDPGGTATITGFDDNIYLDNMLAWPSPATINLEAQDGTGGSGYDERTGVFETVARAYVNANIGPSAPVGRRIPLLQLAPDLGRGDAVTGSARFEKLGELLTTLSNAGGGLGFRIRQDDLRLLFEVIAPQDRSAAIRFSLPGGSLTKITRTVTAPAATVAIVGGAGEDSARILMPVTTDESAAAQALWGRRVERFVDSQSEADEDALTQAGVDSLTDDGKTITSLVVELADTPTRRFGVHYQLGDMVTVDVAGVGEIQDRLTAATISFGAGGVTAKAVVGDPDTAVRSQALRAARATFKQARRISALERRH